MSGVNMVFIRDTAQSLRAAAYLVNTLPARGGRDRLETLDDLDDYLVVNPYTGAIRRDARELGEIRAVRPRLHRLWEVGREEAVPLVNEMLRDGGALPQLVIHDGYDWHIHGTADDEPLATRITVEVALAFVDVIRADEYERVRVCEADDCANVYIDFSRNRSKRYCDEGNCGNRMNVNAYRRRRAKRGSG